jgi:DNA-binding NarL/FixJ family response regulator
VTVGELIRASDTARPQFPQRGSADALPATMARVPERAIISSVQVTGVLVTASDELLAILKHDALQTPRVMSDSNRTEKPNLLVLKLAEDDHQDGNHTAALLDGSVGNAHASLISDAVALLAGTAPAGSHERRDELLEPLTEGEARVLRHLPTGLSRREIADHLYVSVHTVKTHILHLYSKLDVHSRVEAIERARALGLLPSSQSGCARLPAGR